MPADVPADAGLADAQRARRCFTELLLVVPGEAAEMIETPSEGDITDRGDWIPPKKVRPGTVEADIAHVFRRAHAETVVEQFLELARADTGGRGEVGDRVLGSGCCGDEVNNVTHRRVVVGGCRVLVERLAHRVCLSD